VNRPLEFSRNLWIQAQLGAPPFVQRAVTPRLHEAKEIARLLARPHLPIWQMQGLGQGGPLVVAYVGWEFAKPFLKNLLFVDDPAEQRIGQIPFWRRNELANVSAGDIVVVEAARHVIRELPHQRAIVLPHYVHHIVDARGDWDDVRGRFRKSVRKNELRWVRKYGYEYDRSQDRRDFEKFYHQMYLPTMEDRHGELASPMSIGAAYQYFRYGWLIRVKREGEWVSGMVCYPQQKVLIAQILGVKDADAQLTREGAVSALYYAAIHWANRRGYEAVNFLGTDPYMDTGWFQHKRKWGAAVSIPPDLHRQIWIGVRRDTPAVSQFLKENPFVVVDRDGDLHGLIIVDDPHNVSAETRQEWEKRYVTPGLRSLLIRSVSDFAAGSLDASDPGVVIPISSTSCPGDGR
jgi:hypothetical protein